MYEVGILEITFAWCMVSPFNLLFAFFSLNHFLKIMILIIASILLPVFLKKTLIIKLDLQSVFYTLSASLYSFPFSLLSVRTSQMYPLIKLVSTSVI